jgi:hypothetical protein
MHVIKQGKINVLYTDLCLQIAGKAAGNLAAYPVLSPGRLNKNPRSYYNEQQREKEPKQYFSESFQVGYLDVKVTNRLLTQIQYQRQ